jgi:hypothetical protein
VFLDGTVGGRNQRMGTKKIDIDAMLDDSQLEIVLGGKTFLVRDFPSEVLYAAAQQPEPENAAAHTLDILRKILGPEMDGIEIGMKAAAKTLEVIVDYVNQPVGNPTPDELDS